MPPSLPLLTLIIHLPGGGERRFDVSEWRTVLGRSSQCDIKIVSKQVSKIHAVIEITDGFAHLRDLGSRNGVEVNGRAIDTAYRLEGNERITLGDARITIDAASQLFRSPDERAALEKLLAEEQQLRESHRMPSLSELSGPEDETPVTVASPAATRPAVMLVGRVLSNPAGERPVLRMLRIVEDDGPRDTARVESFVLELERGEQVWVKPSADVEPPTLDGFDAAPNVWVDEPEDVGLGGAILARGTYHLPHEVKVVGATSAGRAPDGRRIYTEGPDGAALLIIAP